VNWRPKLQIIHAIIIIIIICVM